MGHQIDEARGALRGSVARLAFILAGVSVLVLGAPPASAAPTEAELKAAYLYHFARYVSWPADAFASPSDPIRICHVGAGALGPALAEAVAGKTVNDRPVRAEARASLEQSAGCHILYAPSIDAGVASGLARRGAFVVSDEKGFATRGGIANFLMVDNKLRFEINAKAAERAGLTVSSRLLRLAQVVE